MPLGQKVARLGWNWERFGDLGPERMRPLGGESFLLFGVPPEVKLGVGVKTAEIPSIRATARP